MSTPNSDALSHFQSEAERVFPHLTEAQRQEREGFVTLPITPEMRAALIPTLTTQSIIVSYILLATVVYLAIVIVTIAALQINSAAVALVPPLLAVPLYFPFARWRRSRWMARADHLTSYRHAGECEITEEYYERYIYKIHLASPPAPSELTVLTLSSTGQHTEWPGIGWRTVDIIGASKGAAIFRIRDERDQVIYPLVR